MPRLLEAFLAASRRFARSTRRGQALLSTSSTKSARSPRATEENRSRYVPGGYHPVRIGDSFDNGQYRVLRKLGYGVYSTVWLVHDTKTKQQVALKILTADTYGKKDSKDSYELAILGCITEKSAAEKGHNGGQHVLGLLHEFHHDGPNGQHVCLVFKAMGPSLSALRDTFPRRRLPIPIAKKVARDVAMGLAFLHNTCDVIHTDIKPANILLETPELDDMFRHAPPEVLEQEQGHSDEHLDDYYMTSEPVISGHEDLVSPHAWKDMSFRLADFGTVSWTHDHLTEWIQPNMLRAPEVIVGAPWDCKADIWNLGLVVWELVTGQLCFDGQATATADYSSEAHLAQMQAILGAFPGGLLSRAGQTQREKYFDSDGNLTSSISFPSLELEKLCIGSGAFDGAGKSGRDDKDMHAFLDFVKSTLALEPEKRPSAQDLLAAEWLKGIANSQWGLSTCTRYMQNSHEIKVAQ